jgi:hypothetical protein
MTSFPFTVVCAFAGGARGRGEGEVEVDAVIVDDEEALAGCRYYEHTTVPLNLRLVSCCRCGSALKMRILKDTGIFGAAGTVLCAVNGTPV